MNYRIQDLTLLNVLGKGLLEQYIHPKKMAKIATLPQSK